MSALARLGYFAVVLGAVLAPSLGRAQNPSEQELDAVAMIRVFSVSTDRTRKEGSGILLGPDGFILTARHLVGDVDRASERITVKFISYSSSPIVAELVECAGGSTDVCLLKIPASAVRVAGVTSFPQLSCRRLEVNENVLAVGWPNPANMELDRVSGTITGGIAAGGLYPTSATALPGYSGGPIYDEANTIIGLVKGGLEPTQTRVFLTPLFAVRTLIAQSPHNCEVSPSQRAQVVQEKGPVRIKPGETRNFPLDLKRDGFVDVIMRSIVPDWTGEELKFTAWELERRGNTPELFLNICSAEEVSSCPTGGQIGNSGSRRRKMPSGPATIHFFNFNENPPIDFAITIRYPG